MKIKYFKFSGLLILLYSIIVFGCGTTKNTVNQSAKHGSKFQSVIDSLYTGNPETKGIMVHIEYPDKNISWSGASGYDDFEKKTTLTPDQPALLASTTKTYVAVAILRLVEDKFTTLETSIENIISSKSKQLLEQDGYDLESIEIKNLLSHTSGIEGCFSDRNVHNTVMKITENKQRRWTRDEHIEEAVSVGDPLGKAGEVFKYDDVNYFLLTEIIEHYYNKPFHIAMKELLKYEGLNLKETWFHTLDKTPQAKPLVHQYFSYYKMHSYDIDPSWDLYGGGGIASTTEELAKFSYLFFNGAIVEDKNVQDLIFTEFEVNENSKILGGPILNYHLGLREFNYGSNTSYGHGGFWGTDVQYFPSINCSIAVFILESDASYKKKIIYEEILKELSKN